jgi:hypothetical protein
VELSGEGVLVAGEGHDRAELVAAVLEGRREIVLDPGEERLVRR